MVANTISSGKERANGVQYDSASIKNRKPLDYFEGKIRENPIKDFIKFAFDGKHKFVTLGIIIAVVIAVIFLILWLNRWSQPDANKDTTPVPEQSWSQELAEITDETYRRLNSESDISYTEALNYIDAKISESTDANHSFDLRIVRAILQNNNGDAQSTVDDLATINEDELTDKQRYALYLSLAYAYRRLGDEPTAGDYDEKINNLPSNATTIGE